MEDAHMEYIPGSHKILNTTNSCSNEVIKKIGIEPVKCFGKKGIRNSYFFIFLDFL